MSRFSSIPVLALFALVSMGCEASVDGSSVPNPPNDNDNDNDSAPDASVPPAIVPPDAAPACSNRVVYLNFTGATLTDAPSDATLNQASWIIDGTANPHVTASLRSTANKLAIAEGLRSQLSQFPVTVVTDRPAAGPYVMVLFGGSPAAVGSRFSYAVQELDCGDVRKSDVAWVADGSSVQVAVNNAMGAIGFGLGLTATLDPSDCMCAWDNDCVPNTNAPCTLSPLIARDPAARQLCPGLTAQDEVATFKTAFCSVTVN